MVSNALGEYSILFENYWLAGMRAKLGLQNIEAEDLHLVNTLLTWMRKGQVDFTNTLRDLSSDKLQLTGGYEEPEFLAWHAQWQLRLRRENRPTTLAYAAMRAVNPAIIPRNHRVEEALAAAEQHDDLSVTNRLLHALATPYEVGPGSEPYQEAPPSDSDYRTFCGT
jgi:uncharacterized protein YdiU (UPF0061 family)